MDVGSLLVADAQSAKLVEPGEAPLDNPAPSTQPATMFGVALGEPRHDMANPQTLPNCLRVYPRSPNTHSGR